MSLRQRLIIIIAIVVVVVGAIVGGLILFSRERADTPPEPTDTLTPTTTPDNTIDNTNFDPTLLTPTPAVNNIPSGLTPKPATSLELEQSLVRSLAKIFTERYNTFSTDSRFENIREVDSLVTRELWQRISMPLNSTPTSTFSAATTQVASTEITRWDSSSADIAVSVVRQENKNGTASSTQLTGSISMVKQNGNWLVSKFSWNP